MNAFTDGWLDARERRLRGAAGATFGVAAVLNFLSEVAGVEGSLWQLIRVVVGIAFLATFVPWLAAIVWRWVPAGDDFTRRRTWVRRVRIAGLALAAAVLVGALVGGNLIAALAMVAVGGALAYELAVEARRKWEA